MCGRYTIVSNSASIKKEFQLDEVQPLEPYYNAVPSYQLPVITSQSSHTVSFFRWGLIPNWAKDRSFGNKTINARSETIQEKASFKMPIRQKRCLVLANCYFEWQKKADGSKIPHLIYCMDQRLFAMAGIWDTWHDPSSKKWVNSFSIITVPAAPRTQVLHERMPAILTPDQRAIYLDSNTVMTEVLSFLQPYENEQMNAMPLGNLVNTPNQNTKEILQPIGDKLY